MSKNSEEIDAACDALLLICKHWHCYPEKLSQKKTDDFFNNLINNGWERKHIYYLLQKTCLPADYDLPAKAIDYLCDVETGIIGFCCPSGITRFPNEPVRNDDELTAYVRSNTWKI